MGKFSCSVSITLATSLLQFNVPTQTHTVVRNNCFRFIPATDVKYRVFYNRENLNCFNRTNYWLMQRKSLLENRRKSFLDALQNFKESDKMRSSFIRIWCALRIASDIVVRSSKLHESGLGLRVNCD